MLGWQPRRGRVGLSRAFGSRLRAAFRERSLQGGARPGRWTHQLFRESSLPRLLPPGRSQPPQRTASRGQPRRRGLPARRDDAAVRPASGRTWAPAASRRSSWSGATPTGCEPRTHALCTGSGGGMDEDGFDAEAEFQRELALLGTRLDEALDGDRSCESGEGGLAAPLSHPLLNLSGQLGEQMRAWSFVCTSRMHATVHAWSRAWMHVASFDSRMHACVRACPALMHAQASDSHVHVTADDDNDEDEDGDDESSEMLLRLQQAMSRQDRQIREFEQELAGARDAAYSAEYATVVATSKAVSLGNGNASSSPALVSLGNGNASSLPALVSLGNGNASSSPALAELAAPDPLSEVGESSASQSYEDASERSNGGNGGAASGLAEARAAENLGFAIGSGSGGGGWKHQPADVAAAVAGLQALLAARPADDAGDATSAGTVGYEAAVRERELLHQRLRQEDAAAAAEKQARREAARKEAAAAAAAADALRSAAESAAAAERSARMAALEAAAAEAEARAKAEADA
eukprot:181739-Chlamydomonas_euryale.AAC.1